MCAPLARHYSLDCHAALAMTRVLSNKNTQSAGDTRARISVIARNEMTKQSSRNNKCADGAALLTGLPRCARNDKGA